MENTRERILETALALFSKDGYAAVSVSTIAAKLGMTKGALYKHYRSKRDIFDQIVLRMERNDFERAKDFALPENDWNAMPEAYAAAPLAQLLVFSRAQFRYWTEDPFASAFRRMLTIEQYSSAEMTALYQNYLGAGPLEYVEELLKSHGVSKAKEKALAFYAPMYYLYSRVDAGMDTAEAYRQLDAHFESAYRQWMEESEA